MILLKMGGSVITDKKTYRKIKEHVLSRISRELIKTHMVIVHGGGSFGHIVSDRYKLQNGIRDENEKIYYSIVGKDMQDLNSIVIDKLIKYGIPAISVPVHAFHMVGETFRVNRFIDLLDRGFVPVTYGDVVLDPKRGMTICSGDQIMFHLAKSLHPERVIFITDVDGIFDKNPKLFSDAKLIEEIKGDENILFGSNVADVTGSMEGKFKVMKNIAKLGIEVLVINGLVPGRVKNAMLGENVKGTRWKI